MRNDLIILHKEINKEANWVKDKETFQEVTVKMVDREMVKMVKKVGKKIDKVMDKRANQEVEQSHEKCRHPGGEREGVAVNEEVEISDLK